MACAVEAEWYLEGSGVPVGWNEGAVAFSEVVPSAVAFRGVATGAILISIVLKCLIKIWSVCSFWCCNIGGM